MICEQKFRTKKNGEPDYRCICRHPELIENYEKAISDTTQTWHCHHRMEAVYTRTELIKYGLYYDREPHQLIFLTNFEHKALHKKSEETKAKMSAAHKGKKRSEETKAKISATQKGKHWKLVDGRRIYY